MSPANRPRRAARVLAEHLDDAAVLYDPATDRLHRLNPSGTILWEHCDGERTISEIARSAHEDLDVDEAVAFFSALHDEGLVEIDNPPAG